MAKFYIGASEISWNDLINSYPNTFRKNGNYTRIIPGSTKRMLHVRGWGEGWIDTEDMRDNKDYGRSTKINIKHVPKYIKEKDYPTFTDWFKAVYSFIENFKTTAKAKAKVKQEQNKTANCLEFYDVDESLQEVMNRRGFVPTELSYIGDEAKREGWKTENERNRAKGWLNLQYTKKLPLGQGRVKLRADVQGKQKIKLMVQGLTAANLQEVLTKVMETL